MLSCYCRPINTENEKNKQVAKNCIAVGIQSILLPFQNAANIISVSLCTRVSAANIDNLDSIIETMLVQLSQLKTVKTAKLLCTYLLELYVILCHPVTFMQC